VKLAYRKGPRRERAGSAEVACGLTSLLMRQPKAGIWCFHSRSHWACHETQGDRRLWNGPQPVLQLPPNPAQDHVRLRSRCMLAESDVQSISPDSSRMISGGCIAWHFRSLWHLGTRYSSNGFPPKPHLSLLIGLLAAALLAGCQPEAETAPPRVRPVR